jgi:DNA-binding XRE family transcriptional regulator
MSIHQRIKQRRLALKLSQKTLGAACGVSWQTVQQTFSG